ncbi:signal recognition particle-docking protein FtsY [Paucilactobacillus oligofermentans DSM 15707 = LMG 22743]|uniref:Signal recognition particle receptor FtsY n=1 Tax=Paucilactobacillus oligofermentans DSM 15707 = LMG 22743 TaxID=1423778 RepID=A0A0R1RCV5_9LACO|nr:signal recognition particle-docking protein FtsY [Paucilactobacillus oligofermentans]KRL54896.1 signal recognition particle-docking protein FtsY [Paucilactobacillus oligofermentans DSM 15707 = LMG 22743]CUS26189.1 Signal recognition particle-docking protein FtsY [Paucilactobacillus oligofermentans DSM 15707 = LMG 22743]
MGLFDIFKRKSSESELPKEVESELPSETLHSETSDSLISSETVIESVSAESVVEIKSETPIQETLILSNSAELIASETATSEQESKPQSVSATSDITSDYLVSSQEVVSEVAVTEPVEEVSNKENSYEKGLEKTRSTFGSRLNEFLANFRSVDEDFFEELEETLIKSDVGFEMAVSISDQLRDEVKLKNAKNKQAVSNVIIEKLVQIYDQQGEHEDNSIHFASQGPTVILFVGVNGVGKTTTIGKMAAKYKQQGKRVLLAAADTFRAGATKQLQVWGERSGVEVITGPDGSDPASVVFDAVNKAKQDNYDVLFVDTAGRLQNKVNLMNELEKMKRIIEREIIGAPQEVLLVLDSTTGQNALTQAKMFKDSTDVTGIVLTKLDGTARGGIVLAIRNELHLPVKFVGLGEKVTDLQEFNASEYVYGLFKGLVTQEG